MLVCGKGLINSFYKYKRKVLPHIWALYKCNSHTHKQPKILFFGTDTFSLPSLQILHKNCRNDLGVVTSFKNPANCVRSYAEREQISLIRWPITTAQCSNYELGVVVSFGHLIPSQIISAFPHGMINVHASLLPRWRGAAPIIYAIMQGDTSTGVTIMKIEPHHFDIGAILAQRELSIKQDIYMPELHTALAQVGADLLLDTINNLDVKMKKAQVQDNANVTYAPKITRHITEIVWSHLTASQIYARHRALYGFKCLTTVFLDKQVHLLEMRLPEKQFQLPTNSTSSEPGLVIYHRARKSLIINCAEGTQLEVLQLRLEQKKPMSAQEFNNGFLKRAHISSAKLHFTQNKQVAC